MNDIIYGSIRVHHSINLRDGGGDLIFIDRNISGGTYYLRLCEKIKTEGSKEARKRVIFNIGPEDEVTDGQPDFLERLRKSFKEGHPIIPELEQFIGVDDKSGKVVYLPFPIEGDSPDGVFANKLLADMILNAYMKELGLSQFFTAVKSKRKTEYDLLGFVKLIVYGRILKPCSKWATIQQNNEYYNPLLKSGFNSYNIYDTLDILHEHRVDIFKTINNALVKRKSGRDTSIVFYDVTNYFFEIELNDPDLLDENGIVIEEGLRKRGHSKESRPQPITQMGLFMDTDGIPIGIKTFPGNKVDKATMIEATSEILGQMGLNRYIFCADRGICTAENLVYLLKDKQGYLLSNSIKKSKKEDRDWIVQSEGYIEELDKNGEVVFKYKSHIVERSYTEENKKSLYIYNEKVVAFWSKEYYDREQHQMEGFSEFLTKLETDTKGFTLNASQISKIKRFLKDEVLASLDPQNDVPEQTTEPENEKKQISEKSESEKTESAEKAESEKIETEKAESSGKTKKKGRPKLSEEEKAQRKAEKKAEAARQKSLKESRKKQLDEKLRDSATTKAMIDWEKVNQWREFAGYYQIVTSELKKGDKEIIETYRGLTQIENRFRTMKGPLMTRPIFLRNPDHIDGHLVSCAIALTIDTLIQDKLKRFQDKNNAQDGKWYLGASPERVQNALNAFQVEAFPQNYLRFRSRSEDDSGKDLELLLNSINVKLESRLYTPKEVRSLRSSFTVL